MRRQHFVHNVFRISLSDDILCFCVYVRVCMCVNAKHGEELDWNGNVQWLVEIVNYYQFLSVFGLLLLFMRWHAKIATRMDSENSSPPLSIRLIRDDVVEQWAPTTFFKWHERIKHNKMNINYYYFYQMPLKCKHIICHTDNQNSECESKKMQRNFHTE